MSATQPKSLRKRLLKWTLIITAVLGLAILGLHLWFVNNAKSLLKQIVVTQSNGKLKIELSQLGFNFFTNRIQIREADLTSTDSISRPTTYRIKFRKLTLRVASFWPLLLKKKLLLDSIDLHNPEIEIMHWRRDTASKITKDELSISQEMGKLYKAMLDGLDNFGIRRIIINNAKVTIHNKMQPGSEPVVISNIYFDLLRGTNPTVKRDEFIKDEQSVDLNTTNQNIALPGGRHRLAFKKFNLQLFRKRIELDSCTVTAMATDSLKSSYSVFFNKLLLIGVDFDAMYRLNLIRADSVYCENPVFDINLYASDAVSKKKERPDPEKIIRELTGDLDLAFVGVKDAGIHINISGKKKRTIFNSNKDDFEMRGLHINADSSKPVVVERFDMLVRDYHLYNEDSSTAYTFDSIHFLNNKIVLNNFSVNTSSSETKIRNQRDFKIPYFELRGLDWYQLIFEENLNAEEAVLYNPVINYVKRTSPGYRKKQNFFALLQSLDSLLTLDKIKIVNGEVNMNLGQGIVFNLQNVNLGLFSNELLQSRNKEGLRKAFESLSFSNGYIRLKDITAQLQNAYHSKEHLLHAEKLFITSSTNKIKAVLNDIYIDNLLLDERTESVLADGLRWKEAKFSLQTSPNKKNNNRNGNFNIKNIYGTNTKLDFSNGETSISGFLQSIKLASLVKEGDAPAQMGGLFIAGKDLVAKNSTINAKASSYQFSNDQSYVTGLMFERIQDKDSVIVTSPRINFSTDFNSMLAKDIHLTNLDVQTPVVRITKWNAAVMPTQTEDKSKIRIDRIMTNEPDIKVSVHRNDSITILSIPRSEKGMVTASDISISDNNISMGAFSAKTNSATLLKNTGEIMGVENGMVDINLSNIAISKKEGKFSWSGLINNLSLQNPNSFALGKQSNQLLFSQVSAGNVNLSSEYIADFNQLIKFNVSAWLKTGNGHYIDSNTTLKWYNAEFNSAKKTLSLDSFRYHPTQPRDSVIAHTPYQTDYISFHSGAVKVTDFNLEKYKKDSALIASTIDITNPVIEVYRDKLPPFLAGIIKPLPVNMIRKIQMPVLVQRINLHDGLVSYTEKNAKTRAEGTFFLTHLNSELINIKNRDIRENDSLLWILNAYLMDSALINLRVKESYSDSLSGFLMSLRMKPTSLSFLNPVLAPLSNVVISSGTIDSLLLRAIGKEDLSLGEMKMYYHNLRIKMVKQGDRNKSSLGNKLLSFLANTFVIRKNNKGRTGIVYFVRLRDKSFFNYIVKMTFSGMATSIGVKKNRKFIKQYKRALQQKNLPPIDFE